VMVLVLVLVLVDDDCTGVPLLLNRSLAKFQSSTKAQEDKSPRRFLVYAQMAVRHR